MHWSRNLVWLGLAALLVGAAGCGDGKSLEDPLPDTCENMEGFNTCAEASFMAFADDTDGEYTSVGSAEEVPDAILGAIDEGTRNGEGYDLMFILDLTGSMGDDLDAVRGRIDEILSALEEKGSADARVGLLTYKDHCIEPDSFTLLDLTSDFDALRTRLDELSASGGGDIPESVYEAVERTMTDASWENDNRFAILIGDAGPHPPEKRETDTMCTFTTYAEAVTAATSKGVEVNLYPILVSTF